MREWLWRLSGDLFVTDFGEARIPNDVPWQDAVGNRLPCDIDQYFAEMAHGIYATFLLGEVYRPWSWADWSMLRDPIHGAAS